MRVLFAILALLGFCTLALAQTATPAADTSVTFGPLLTALTPYFIPLVGILITALTGWIATLISKSTGSTISATNRDALHSALETGVNLALAKLGPSATTAIGGIKVDVKSAVIAQAVMWAQTSVPDAIKFFGITPDSLAAMASAKLQVADPTAPSIPAAAAPAASSAPTA